MYADGHPDIHAPNLSPPEPSGGLTVKEFCLHLLDVARRMVNCVPGTDILTLRCFLFDVLPPEYREQIDQICCQQPRPAGNNIIINTPGNMVAPGAQTAVLNDQFLPPQAAMGG